MSNVLYKPRDDAKYGETLEKLFEFYAENLQSGSQNSGVNFLWEDFFRTSLLLIHHYCENRMLEKAEKVHDLAMQYSPPADWSSRLPPEFSDRKESRSR